MGAFEDMLKKQGYVKLDRYGLVLTEDDRILSMRPAVLDDGLGGKIVGWADGDLAAAELENWGAAKKPAAAKPVAVNRSVHQPPPPLTPRPPAPAVVVAKPAVVAAAPVVEEDEWEWEIAMARARAVAEDVETAAASISTSFTAPKKTMPTLATGSGPISSTATSLAAASSKPDPMSAWPVTEPLQQSWGDATRESPSPQVMSPAAKTLAVVKSEATGRVNTPPRGASTGRSTVIPVPSLPVAARPSDVRPAFNPGQPPKRLAAQARMRMARGTESTTKHTDDTVLTAPVKPANDDRTSPYVMLPPEVKPGPGFAHTKRVAAKHR